MHAHFLDPYKDLDSPVHRQDARTKLVLVVVFIFTVSLTPVGAWPVFILLLALVLSAELLSNLGVGFYLKRALLALPFVMAALPILFTSQGETLAVLPLGLSISFSGLERFLSITLKSWISVQAAILLASTTTFPDILAGMRALHLPRLFVAIVGLMWRYLFVIVDEVLRMLRARQSRSGELLGSQNRPGGAVLWRARVTGAMAGSLLLRSIERSDRIYNAMLSRGYDGEVRNLPHPAFRAADWAVLAGLIFLFLLILALGQLVWG
jgi:cobalt/nickel transport system permease protein